MGRIVGDVIGYGLMVALVLLLLAAVLYVISRAEGF